MLFANKGKQVFGNIQIQIKEQIEQEVRNFLTGFLETMLEEELKIFIGRDRYKRRSEKQIRLYRNGYRVRNYLTIWSKMLRLRVPRCRSGNFKPLLFREGGMNSEEIVHMLIQLWVEGSSYRDLSVLVKKIYGEHYSIGIFGRMISRVRKYAEEFHRRKILFKYDCINIDALEISIKELPKRNSNYTEGSCRKGKNAATLCVLGQRREGKKVIREILDFRICSTENERGYTSLLEDLKKRGLTSENMGLIVHDGHLSISKAIKNVYGKDKVLQQECLVHHKRNVVNKIEKKINKKPLGNEVWEVYSSKTEEEFKNRHKKLVKKWESIEPEAVKQFKKVNRKMLTKYQFDIRLHKAYHSSNTIERYFREIRRRIKAMGIFETVKSADKLLFLIIEYINQRRGSIPTNSNLNFTH
ncbi:MAG: IS256 family transposase [Ignavibacteria bacterium]